MIPTMTTVTCTGIFETINPATEQKIADVAQGDATDIDRAVKAARAAFEDVDRRYEEVAATLGRTDFRRCIVMHSLSKRSSAPGLRSGFVAGDAELLQTYLRYRTYHGCAMSLHVQAASAAAWADEAHVQGC